MDSPLFGSDPLPPDDYSLFMHGEDGGLVEGVVFRDNLRALMDYAERTGDPGLATPEALEERSGVSRSNLYRYLNLDTSPTLEKLEAIAKAYGLMVWQLLTPRLDPSNPPVVFVTPTEQELYKRIRSVGEQMRLEGNNAEAVGSTAGPDPDSKGQAKARKRGRPRKIRLP